MSAQTEGKAGVKGRKDHRLLAGNRAVGKVKVQIGVVWG